MHKLFSTLSIKLLLIFLLAFIILILLLRAGFGHSLKSEINTLQGNNLIRTTGFIYEPRKRNVNINRAERIAEQFGWKIYIMDEKNYWSSDDTKPSFEEINFKKIDSKHKKIWRVSNHKRPNIYFSLYKNERYYKAVFPDSDITVIYNLGAYQKISFRFYWLAIGIIFLFLLFIAINYLFSPLRKITDVVQSISHGDLSARVNITRNDELGILGEKINVMANDIEQTLEAKKALLLAISHELRTPITRSKVALELMDDNKQTNAIRHDINEIEHIVSELLDAEKFSDSAVIREVASINNVVTDVIERYFDQDAILFTPLADDPFLNIDAIRIKLLLKNLIRNAINYTPEGRLKPSVSLELDETQLLIKVQDYGVGVEPENLTKITEAFYRTDPSRQRKTGGYGLGLYLCKVIALAHDGSIDISSELDQGTLVSVTIRL